MAPYKVLIRCPSVPCGRMTGWSYPSLQWAKSHVPGLPPRCYLISQDGRRPLGMRDELCEDPFGHANAVLARLGRPLLTPDVGYAPPEEEVVDDPNGESDEDYDHVFDDPAAPDFAAIARALQKLDE